MINSKGIKLLCKIIMGIVYFFGICSFIAGISSLVDGENIGILYIVLGLLLPLMTTVSLYPIFALANIDENVHLINNKIDLLIGDQSKTASPSSEKVEQQSFDNKPPKNNYSSQMQKRFEEKANRQPVDDKPVKNNQYSPVQQWLEGKIEHQTLDDEPVQSDDHTVVRKSREGNDTISPIDFVGIPNVDEAFDALQKLYHNGFIGEPTYKIQKTYDRTGVLMWHCECHVSGKEKFCEGDFYSEEYGKEATAYQMILDVLGVEEDEEN